MKEKNRLVDDEHMAHCLYTVRRVNDMAVIPVAT